MSSTLNTFRSDTLGVVVIGRNEGERLARCLASVRAIPNRVYVDSGSTDASVAFARREGVICHAPTFPQDLRQPSSLATAGKL